MAAQTEFKTVLFGSPTLDFVLSGDPIPLKVPPPPATPRPGQSLVPGGHRDC